ncbi:hypothetical protein ACFQY7_01690 [Actinomadura luteofluorescens]|uniref:hypothetical protein n=1 Tax=Actinomadura luteofluorescens TaxID=46163 RepID=UPI003627E46F
MSSGTGVPQGEKTCGPGPTHRWDRRPWNPARPGPGWTPQPQRISPSAGWYALPVVLVLVAAIGFLTLLALLWDDSEVAGGPSAAGDPAAGVTVRLTEGYGYFVYVREGGPSPYACRVEAGSGPGPSSSRGRTPGAPPTTRPTATPPRSGRRCRARPG